MAVDWASYLKKVDEAKRFWRGDRVRRPPTSWPDHESCNNPLDTRSTRLSDVSTLEGGSCPVLVLFWLKWWCNELILESWDFKPFFNLFGDCATCSCILARSHYLSSDPLSWYKTFTQSIQILWWCRFLELSPPLEKIYRWMTKYSNLGNPKSLKWMTSRMTMLISSYSRPGGAGIPDEARNGIDAQFLGVLFSFIISPNCRPLLKKTTILKKYPAKSVSHPSLELSASTTAASHLLQIISIHRAAGRPTKHLPILRYNTWPARFNFSMLFVLSLFSINSDAIIDTHFFPYTIPCHRQVTWRFQKLEILRLSLQLITK